MKEAARAKEKLNFSRKKRDIEKSLLIADVRLRRNLRSKFVADRASRLGGVVRTNASLHTPLSTYCSIVLLSSFAFREISI